MKVNTIQNDNIKNIIRDKPDLFRILKENEIIEGTVLAKEKNNVFLDLGIYGTGIIYGKEFYEAQSTLKNIKPGDKLTAKIVETENDDGYIELSLKEADKELAWDKIKKSMESGEVFTAKIIDANKGGLIANIFDEEAFLPVSHLTISRYPRVEDGDKNKILQELKKIIGENLRVKIIDANQNEGKIVISEKEAGDEQFEKAISRYKVGDIVEGKITEVMDFGIFVKFDPVLEGMVHRSELAWQIVEKPEILFKIGGKVKTKIIDIADGKISLSIKATQKDPWEETDKKYKKGMVVKGEVRKVASVGAFVWLDKDIHGLAHVSQFGSLKNLEEKIEIDKKYDFKIETLDPENHKMGLKFIESPREAQAQEKIE